MSKRPKQASEYTKRCVRYAIDDWDGMNWPAAEAELVARDYCTITEAKGMSELEIAQAYLAFTNKTPRTIDGRRVTNETAVFTTSFDSADDSNDKIDLAILAVMRGYPDRRWTNLELAQATRFSERTVSERIRHLIGKHFAERPAGRNSGAKITQQGIAVPEDYLKITP